MSRGHDTIAITKAGRVYTLEAHYDYGPLGGGLKKRHPYWKWRGYCDGDHFGLFRTRAEWEARVANEPELVPWGEHTKATFDAIRESTWDGNYILGKITAALQRQKEREKTCPAPRADTPCTDSAAS